MGKTGFGGLGFRVEWVEGALRVWQFVFRRVHEFEGFQELFRGFLKEVYGFQGFGFERFQGFKS